MVVMVKAELTSAGIEHHPLSPDFGLVESASTLIFH